MNGRRWMTAALALLTVMAVGFAVSGEGRRGRQPPKPEIRVVTDPEVEDLLKEIGAPLTLAAGLPEGRVRYHVILDSRLNAFALPNQRIVLHSGLLLAAAGRDELAAVMAHETAHLAAGHHIQIKGIMRGISLQTLAAMAVGVAAGLAARNSDITSAAMIGGSASGQSMLLEELRRKETQADRLGIMYLSRAGFDPMGMPGFLERLNRESRLQGMPPPYLLTHPMSSLRLTEAKDQAEATPPETPLLNTDALRLERVQAKLLAHTTEDPAEAEAEFRRRLVEKPTDLAARYGLALALGNGGEQAEAEKRLTALIQETGGDPHMLRERGLARLDLGDLKGAEADTRAALTKLPDHPDLRYRLAFVLHQGGRQDEAAQLLHRLTLEEPEEARYLYLLGMVEGKRERVGPSNLALARYHRGQLSREKAIWHYKQAIKHLPEGSGDRQSAMQEMAELEQGPKNLGE
ncbi:MAG: M48 family metalloprotease [Magnetococcales bacterium]|nr:M48 family metalloprotease [Magnetococcales bacterium]